MTATEAWRRMARADVRLPGYLARTYPQATNERGFEPL